MKLLTDFFGEILFEKRDVALATNHSILDHSPDPRIYQTSHHCEAGLKFESWKCRQTNNGLGSSLYL